MAKEEHRLIDIDHPDTVLRTFILFVQTADAVRKYADSLLYHKAGLSVIKFMILQILINGIVIY